MRESWNKFLDGIKIARAELGNPSIVWYRGHRNSDWTLIPTLLRLNGDIKKEKFLFHEFKRSAARIFANRKSDWETLLDMQHYGIPTRLLDWSEVLGISLAFTLLEDYPEASDSAVFILDPVSLNALSGVRGVQSVPDDTGFDYQSIYWHNRPFAASLPIAIDPPFQSDRMLAQKGVFTIHGSDPRPLEDQCPQYIKKVILPKGAKDGALEFLEHANLNEYTTVRLKTE